MKRLYKKIISLFKDNYTQEISIDTENQCYVYKCYKNGKYTHTVNMYYYTKNQIKDFQETTEKISNNG